MPYRPKRSLLRIWTSFREIGSTASHPASPFAISHGSALSIYLLDPLSDNRWDALVARHPLASAFHQRSWLEALARTYKYEPLVLTTSAASKQLTDGMVVCRVSSWMTGCRFVSLPFADHCDILQNECGETIEFTNWLRAECDRENLRYIELRPRLGVPDASSGLQTNRSYWFHELDLGLPLEQIFRRLHQNSFQRKIRRAERERLTYECGRSQELLDQFYRLLVITRRRHRVLPPPRRWFRNLAECMGDQLDIRVARKNGDAIAAMITLRHGLSIIYKYGCSDEKVHRFGGMPFLFWRLIEEGKLSGANRIDLGRTDYDDEGLMTFKDRLGAARKVLNYYRYTSAGWMKSSPIVPVRGIGLLFSVCPDAILCTAGRLLYRHIG